MYLFKALLVIILQGQKDFFLQAVYRQWEIRGRINSDKIGAQLKRFQIIVKKWKEVASIHKVITIGDINLNSLSWATEPKLRSSHDRSLIKLVDLLHTDILVLGTVKVNNLPTYLINSNPRCLNHIYSNNPQSIINTETDNKSFSDHSILVATRSAQTSKGEQMYYLTRDMKKFSPERYANAITNDSDYLEALTNDDPDVIAELTQKILGSNLDRMAPTKRVQV